MTDDKMLNGLTEAETTATVSVAGLSKSALPVVAWRSRYRSEPRMIGHYPWSFTDRVRGMQLPQYEYEPLTLQAPTQAAIDALRADNERLTRERDEALEARRQAQRESADLKERVARIAHEMRLEHSAALAALKAKQVADVEAVMKLADDWVEQSLRRYRGLVHKEDAAREALRAYITRYRT